MGYTEKDQFRFLFLIDVVEPYRAHNVALNRRIIKAIQPIPIVELGYSNNHTYNIKRYYDNIQAFNLYFIIQTVIRENVEDFFCIFIAFELILSKHMIWSGILLTKHNTKKLL